MQLPSRSWQIFLSPKKSSLSCPSGEGFILRRTTVLEHRRTFLRMSLMSLAYMASACSQNNNPVAPSSPNSGNSRIQPILTYIRYGWASQRTSLLNAIQEHNPILTTYRSEDGYFVDGFQGMRISRLVFYIDNQPFGDRGVSSKTLALNQLWGVMQV